MSENKWLDWAVELQSLAQAGLKYTMMCLIGNALSESAKYRRRFWLTKAISRLKRCAIFLL